MNMLEIANHFVDQVEILVGSQQTEPGDGWPYDKVIAAMKKATSSAGLASQIVKLYIDDYRSRGVFDVTQSAINVSKTEPAIAALSNLGALLAAKAGVYHEQLKKVRIQVQSFQMADYVDLVHVAESISREIKDTAIRRAAAEVSRTTSACILQAGKCGRTVSNAHGLSVWFPSTESLYYSYRAKYMSLRFATKYRGWVEFLDVYHS